jgi:hypothetical protein
VRDRNTRRGELDMADRQTIRGSSAANPEFRGWVRAEDGGQVFVYNGGLDFDETGAFVVSRGPNIVLEVIDASVMAARDRPPSSDAVPGHGAVHVELRPAAAKRLVALLLGRHERHRGG